MPQNTVEEILISKRSFCGIPLFKGRISSIFIFRTVSLKGDPMMNFSQKVSLLGETHLRLIIV